MGRTACREPQCLYKGDLYFTYLFWLYNLSVSRSIKNIFLYLPLIVMDLKLLTNAATSPSWCSHLVCPRYVSVSLKSPLHPLGVWETKSRRYNCASRQSPVHSSVADSIKNFVSLSHSRSNSRSTLQQLKCSFVHPTGKMTESPQLSLGGPSPLCIVYQS